MNLRRVAAALGVTAGAAALAPLAGRWKWSRETDRRVGALRAATADRPATASVDSASLPDPVREYFDTVLDDDEPIRAARLEQEGDLKTGGESSPWRSFAATHHVATGPPGFVWDARVSFLPFVSVRVRDSYVAGAGSGDVALFGLLPLGGSGPSPELNEAELQRYLAEAVWYPTALRPEAGVEWTAVDAETAEATLERDGVRATLAFTFEDGLVRSVHTDARYRSVDGGFEATPWTGYWDDYERRDGVLVPTAGEVVWHLPDGDLHAWRGRLTGVEYDRDEGGRR